jgi:hypothetical protein
MDSEKMVMTAADASFAYNVCEGDDDVLNEVRSYLCLSVFTYFMLRKISLDASAKNIAFSTDSGHVGILNLQSKSVIRMKAKHETVRVVCRSFTRLLFIILLPDMFLGQIHP